MSAKATNTICVSLEPRYVEILGRLARKAGSRSAAVRRLLDEHERVEAMMQLEAAYRAYFDEPGAAGAERGLTEDMLSVSRWPARQRAPGMKRAARKKHTARRGLDR